MSSLLDLALGEKEESEKFTAEELSMGMREAKAKYSQDDFRRWKRAKNKSSWERRVLS